MTDEAKGVVVGLIRSLGPATAGVCVGTIVCDEVGEHLAHKRAIADLCDDKADKFRIDMTILSSSTLAYGVTAFGLYKMDRFIGSGLKTLASTFAKIS